MSETYIPGYLGDVTIGGDDWSIVGKVVGVSGSKDTMRKAVFGQQAKRVIGGPVSFSFNASGHVEKDDPLAKLFAAFVATTPVAFVIQVGEASGATDAGTIGGNLVVSSIDVTADAEGEWDWSLAAEVDGSAAHTPAA